MNLNSLDNASVSWLVHNFTLIFFEIQSHKLIFCFVFQYSTTKS